MSTTTRSRSIPSKARSAALVLALSIGGLISLPASPASAATSPPTLRTAPRLSVSTVPVGTTVTSAPPTFSGTVTRIDYAWEFCTLRPGASLACNETGVWGNRYTPTLASTGGMTLARWGAGSYYVRVRAVAYNGTRASAPTWSPLARVVPGMARGQLDLVEWWDGSTFAVYGEAAADGVDGAIPFRLRAVRRDGVTVAQTFGTTSLLRTERRGIWPNTGNWGGFNVAVNGAGAASTVCLDVGTSYVPVVCQPLPVNPPTMRAAG